MKRIHVNQLVIRHNKKYGNKLPAIRIEDIDTGEIIYCKRVKMGPSTMIYRPEDPLPCGAKLWIECEETIAVQPVKYSKIKKQMEEL